MERDYNYDILPEIKKRYAAKFFDGERLGRDDLLPLVEAARYAPSCYNEQPWRFLLGDTPEVFGKLASTLAAGNAWAKDAGALVLVLCTRSFKLNGKPNAYSRFDAGTASGFFQLEAVRRGLACHSMAGFDAEAARRFFAVPEELDIVDMIALGRPATAEALTAEQRAQDVPGTRNPLMDSLYEGDAGNA